MTYVQDGAVVTLTGDPQGWPGASYNLGELNGNTATEDSWTTGTGPDLWTWTLDTPFPETVPETKSPALVYDDLNAQVSVTYATPQPTFSGWPQGEPTTVDYVVFDRCPDQVTITSQYLLQDRAATTNSGHAVTTSFYWPPPPTGAVAGYTANLVAFVETTLSGFTTDPIVLTDYWSQTYRPGHHNFDEYFIFEPGLSADVSAAQLAELEAAGIRYIHLEVGFDTGIISTAGDDGAFTVVP